MGKVKRLGKKKEKSGGPDIDSDDERAYSREAVPDPTSEEYYQDEVDEFHSRREKILLDRGADLEPSGYSSDEEEVLGFDDDEDEDMEEYERQLQRFRSRGFKDELASDVDEDEEAGDGLPDEKAWGKRRSKYYGADVSDNEDIDFSGSEPDAAILEEQEALVIQQRMAEQLEEEDFGLEIFKKVKKPKETEGEEKISKDLSTLSKKEKLQLLKKESPELLHLIDDYKVKMSEVQDRLLPIFTLIKKGVLPQSKGTDYVQAKLRLCLNYCINLTFYVMLMARRTNVQNHPVIGRLLQYRNLLKQLEDVDKTVSAEIEELLNKIKNGQEICYADYATRKQATKTKPSSILKRRKLLNVATTKKTTSGEVDSKEKRKLSEMVSGSESEEEVDSVEPTGGRTWGRKRGKLDEETPEENIYTKDEKEALEFYEMLKAGRKKKGIETESLRGEGEEEEFAEDEEDYYDEEDEEGGKRGITYQIEKNKGLTPKRKREQRNPRVKHRMKYRKAKIRRKGQVREVRTEMSRYGGEISGIRAGVKKGVRLK